MDGALGCWVDDVMVAPRALCMVGNTRTRKSLCRTLQAAGVAVTCMDALPDVLAWKAKPAGALVFIDEGMLRTAGPDVLRQRIGADTRIVMLNGSLDDADVARLVRDHVDHVVDVRDDLDERGLLVTSTKLLTGDIFGLEKYLAWGARVCQQAIAGYDDKRAAVDAVTAYARGAGAGRRVARNVECVAQELLMNALYDAEAIGGGAAGDQGTGHALLRYASDGRHLAVSVTDRWGALRKEMVIDALMRAQAERGAPRQSGRGAGLGFYMILASATQVIANIDPGRRTEVVCLFDLRQSNRDATRISRAFHMFYQQREARVLKPRC